MRIDVHNHAIPEPALDLLRREPVYGVRIRGGMITGGNHPDFPLDESFFDPAAKLAELERMGIGGAIVSIAPTTFYYEVDAGAGAEMAHAVNHGLAAFAAQDAQRLSWMAHLPLQSPEWAATLLDDAAARGAVAVEVGTCIAGRRLDEPDFDAFWDNAERLRMPVMLHPAYNEPHPGMAGYYLQNVIGNMLETTIAVERLICAGVLDRHTGVELILPHSGGYFPYQAGRLRHAGTVRPEIADSLDPWIYLGRLWFDTITHDSEALRYLIRRVGSERVVFGTDLPFDMAPPNPMHELERAVDADALRQVAEENPARLFRLEART
jgi:aminocarboxymuconate-semialdehyde decarboxylase